MIIPMSFQRVFALFYFIWSLLLELYSILFKVIPACDGASICKTCVNVLPFALNLLIFFQLRLRCSSSTFEYPLLWSMLWVSSVHLSSIPLFMMMLENRISEDNSRIDQELIPSHWSRWCRPCLDWSLFSRTTLTVRWWRQFTFIICRRQEYRWSRGSWDCRIPSQPSNRCCCWIPPRPAIVYKCPLSNA